MKTKTFTLFSFFEEGFSHILEARIKENSEFWNVGTTFQRKDNKRFYLTNKKKLLLRSGDRNWVIHNIPSSIWWHTEIHHDWANNGTMFLLTKGEHILRHRREKE